MAEQNACAPNCGEICREIKEGMNPKTAFPGMLETYKEFYPTCPPDFSPKDTFDLVYKAFCARMWITIINTILTIVLFLIGGVPVGPLIVGILIALIIAFLQFFWVITAVKRPANECCCSRPINMWILVVVYIVSLVLQLLDMIKYFQAAGVSWVYIVNAILVVWDMTLLIPLVMYGIQAARSLSEGGAAAKTPEFSGAATGGVTV